MKKSLMALSIGICFLMVVPCLAADKVITLTLTDQNPETGWGSVNATLPWIKKVEEATNGRVKIQPYFSQTLAKGKDSWNAAKTGIADMAWCAQGYWPGMTEMAAVITLAGLPIHSAEKGSEVLWKLYEKFPEVRAGYKDIHVLNLFTTSPYYLISSKKQIKTVADLKGMKIRTFGSQQAKLMKALGAIPTSIPMPETYIALQKGVVDGMASPWDPLYSFRLYEVAPKLTYAPVNVVYFSIVMNKKKWNSLPKDIQDAITSVSGLEGSKSFGKGMFDSGKEAVMANAKKAGSPIVEYTFPPAEQKKWSEVGGKPLWEQWVKEKEAEGYSKAREILNATLEMLK
jgi:TRAP-type C4-dicarboxylate transport system substrate-binding protein